MFDWNEWKKNKTGLSHNSRRELLYSVTQAELNSNNAHAQYSLIKQTLVQHLSQMKI